MDELASSHPEPDNIDIADLLNRIADLLDTQNENSYRVRAYRNAARTARGLDDSITAMLREGGRHQIERLPSIGRSISTLLDEFVHTGRSRLLDRLEGQVSPEDLFTTVPGVGELLAHRIHEELGIETLEALEVAAHDGRLEGVTAIGPRRIAGIRDSVAAILDRSTRRRAHQRHLPKLPLRRDHEPDVRLLLAVDSEYRQKARTGDLKTIAPRRFNPKRKSWLPVLHTQRNGWSLTAMFSNTARAHQLGMTCNWVVIYYEREGDESQCTVVTERRGPLTGQRVVRGREWECTKNESTESADRLSQRTCNNRRAPARDYSLHRTSDG
jgi:DNA polymerase (family 10)